MTRFELLPRMIADIDLMLKIRDADPHTRLKIIAAIPYMKLSRIMQTFWALDTVDLEQLRHSLFIEFTAYLPHIALTEIESILHLDK